MTPQYVPLAELARELEQSTGERSPTYRSLYSMVLSGDLPADRNRNRWFVKRDDIKPIAVMLGLLTLDGQKIPKNGACTHAKVRRPDLTIAQARVGLLRHGAAPPRDKGSRVST